ncbi:hypothetical protein QNI16_07355 [Cytophagaceae bacterium YF14B1]|uniref:Uncharacterized protein n=1 Tax=Xanthocytophaga flava TaxID=3048013 RepID=A0AAE3QNQ0_9BACT|nr:hypothetical protein [Xanthocytophaga flavus]MDJ1480296.1 hypothetical protein [Xanthocytophaga flavus]
MAEKTNVQIARSWAAVTFKKWRAEIKRLKIGKTGNLTSSFQAFVTAESGGDITKIRILYAYYGKFVDMGVGRGRKLGSSDTAMVNKLLGGKPRKKKQWYSKVIAKEAYILAQILQANAGNKSISVLNTITSTVRLEM